MFLVSFIRLQQGTPLCKYTMIYLFIYPLTDTEIRGSQTSPYTGISWELQNIVGLCPNPELVIFLIWYVGWTLEFFKDLQVIPTCRQVWELLK